MNTTKDSLSKIRNLKHNKINLSNYLKLENINAFEAKAVFQFRSRMAKFSGNYKGNSPVKICPLCSSHPDTQEWSFKCLEIKKNIQVNSNYNNIFEGKITKNLAKTVLSIIKFRDTSLNGAQ